MKWTRDDSYLHKTKGLARLIVGRGDRPLPWWFWNRALCYLIKLFVWDCAVMFGASEDRAKAGYKVGLIVDGHAYVGGEVLHHRDAYICISSKRSWTIFAVDPENGEVIADEGATPGENKPFWVDIHPEDILSQYLDGRQSID
jgi:hypothetical protein